MNNLIFLFAIGVASAVANHSPLLDIGLPKFAPNIPVLRNPHPACSGNLAYVVSPAGQRASYTTFAKGLPQSRILGGQVAQIQSFPYAVAALNTRNGFEYYQECGGVILNSRSVLTAANCFYFTSPQSWRIRAGSSYANSGGEVYTVSQLISHPQFVPNFLENDIGIMRISSAFLLSNRVQVGSFAGVDYVVADNATVLAVGWGAVSNNASSRSEQLRYVQTSTVNQEVCRSNYNIISMTVLPNMMCAGNLLNGGVGPCYGDFGGPLIHNNVVIGIASWSSGCGYRGYPTVFSRVPKYITWIRNNA